MGNKDVISKSVLCHLTADIANLLLGLGVDANSVELLDTEQQRVEQRRADLVARMQRHADGQAFILHVEIQNHNDSTMPLRMLRYFTDIQLAYPQEPVHQHLIYIGKERLTMPDQFAAPAFTYRYQMLDMHTVDCSILLEQDTPDALVLAILCDFKGQSVQDVVNYIVLRLRELMGDDESGFRNYFGMLETLAENRNLQPNLEEAEKMLTQVDVTKFASYRWGLKAGMAEGIEQGIEKGIEQGMQQGAMRERLRVAQQLIGLLDEQTIADKTGLSLEEVRQLTLH
jgi:predicted transposase YdaD